MTSCARVQPCRFLELNQRLIDSIRLEIASRKLCAEPGIVRLHLQPLLVSCNVVSENLGPEVALEKRQVSRVARDDLEPERSHFRGARLAERDPLRRPVWIATVRRRIVVRVPHLDARALW